MKNNDLEFCPRPSQRTCWGHYGSSRGRDSVFRRSSSLYPLLVLFSSYHILLFYPHAVLLLLYPFLMLFSSSFFPVHFCFSSPLPLLSSASSPSFTLSQPLSSLSLPHHSPMQVLGEGNFGKVWKAEVDDICGYEGTILVAVKGVKASVQALIAMDPPFEQNFLNFKKLCLS